MRVPKASIIIPTKNPGVAFHAVLSSIRTQKTDFMFDVLVIDSGSDDGTVEYVRQIDDGRIRLYEIPPETFGHGKTRNLGVSLTSGEYAVLVTHDARPVHYDWLAILVATADTDTNIAGVFGRHLPQPRANPFTARDLRLHFKQFEREPIQAIQDAQAYVKDANYRRKLRFFSDNNALLRRSVWEKIPYQDVDFAEDQMWAKQVLESGWKIAYANEASVYHSHDYGLIERLRRSFDEGYALRQLFEDQQFRSFVHAFLSCCRRTGRDFAYAYQSGLLRSNFRDVLKMPADNFMRASGYYIGGYGRRLSPRLRRWLSLDRRMLLGLDARVDQARNNEHL
jgi:rhamnosyltransferase